jgi:D-Tyr-tRNAtyr deacylase
VPRARVLDVGNCDPDHGAIRRLLEANFDVDVDRVMFVDAALRALRAQHYDLALVNRRIFDDDSDGMQLVRAVAAVPEIRTPVMLISNFADAQAAAVAAGARPGFGKAALHDRETLRLLGEYVPRLDPKVT